MGGRNIRLWRDGAIIAAVVILGWIVVSWIASPSPPPAQITWYGVYQTRHDAVEANPGGLNGKWIVSTGIMPPAVSSDRIPAKLNTRFGFGFNLPGGPTDAPVQYRAVQIYPAPGIVSTSGKRYRSDAIEVDAQNGKELFDGFLFEHVAELIPGKWTFQIWFRNKKVLEQSFTVYLPDQHSGPGLSR